jgi:hypothetical protein
MMPKTLQAKHIQDLPILEFLFKLRLSGGQYEFGSLSTYPIWGYRRLVFAMPIDTPWKVRAAKMKALSRRGLVDEFRNGQVMPRYKMIAGSDHSCCFKASVVDNERPVLDGDGEPMAGTYEVVCECFEEGTAMMIADALNKADM